MKVDQLILKFKHLPEKGRTFCTISVEGEDEVEITGEASCSEKDPYSKDTGRKVSMKRALEKAGIKKELRSKIWESYRTMTKVPRWNVSKVNKLEVVR